MGQDKTTKSAAATVGSDAGSAGATATASRPKGNRSKATGAKSGFAAKTANISQEQIAQRAREIWIRNGCKPGQDEQNWLEAERQLKAELGGR